MHRYSHNSLLDFEAIVIGVSAGGIDALERILPELPSDFRLPIIIVHHRHKTRDNHYINILQDICKLEVREAEEKEAILSGRIYIAPAGYHLLIESNRIFSLSCERPVRFARPSIDVLFESASEVYGAKLIGVILTGSNNDGSMGLKMIKERNGFAVVHDPGTSYAPSMPIAAIKAVNIDRILPLEEIGCFLSRLDKNNLQKSRGYQIGE